MQVLAPTARTSLCTSSTPTHVLALALLLPLSAASQQPGNTNTSRKILKKIIVKKSKSNLTPNGTFEGARMVQERDFHPNSIHDSYGAPAIAYSTPPPTNLSSGYLPPPSSEAEEEDAMETMLMSMAGNLTPPSVHYDPYLMHGGGGGMMTMPMSMHSQGQYSKCSTTKSGSWLEMWIIVSRQFMLRFCMIELVIH